MRKLTVGPQAAMILALSFGLQAQQVVFTGKGATDGFEAANPGATLLRVDQHGATYRNGKSYTLVTGPGLVYQNGSQWQITKPQIQALPNNGGWQMQQTPVPVVLTGLDPTKKTRRLRTASGTATLDLELPDVTHAGDNAFTFLSDGQVWTLTMQQTGTLLTTTVRTKQGSKHYSFGYDASGPALSVDPKGNLLVAGGLLTTRPTVITADHKIVPCSAWDIKGNQIGFTCDDSTLAATAFPYVIDPATTSFGPSGISCGGYDDGSTCRLYNANPDTSETFSATIPINLPSNATVTNVNVGSDITTSAFYTNCEASATTTTPSGSLSYPNYHLDWFNLHGQNITWSLTAEPPDVSYSCALLVSDSAYAQITYLAPPTMTYNGTTGTLATGNWITVALTGQDPAGFFNLLTGGLSLGLDDTATKCEMTLMPYVIYVPPNSTGGVAWGNGSGPGSQASTGDCIVRGTGSTVTTSGCQSGCPGSMTYTVSVNFTAGGTKSVLANWTNGDLQSTGTQTVGSFSIPFPPVNHTVVSSPPGLYLVTDGSLCYSPCTVQWIPGSTHTIATQATQFDTAVPGRQYLFGSWSDGGAISHVVTGASASMTYTANFTTQYYLTTTAGSGGSITPVSGWYNSGSVVSVGAQASAGFQFTGFSGGLSGTVTPQNATMTAPVSVSASFGALVSNTVTTSPAGRGLTIDGSACTAPCTFQWLPGSSHSIAAATPQAGTTGTQFVFASWSQGGAASQTVTAAASATTYTASFTTQYYLTTSAGVGGSITPASGWQNSGAVVPVNATASAGYQFSGFSGDITGVTTPQNVTMAAPRSVTASFTAAIQTVTSAPAGLSIMVDGTACTTPCTFQWAAGSNHSVAAGTVPGGVGTQYAFVSWSQGGAASQSITAAATPNIYTATYKTQYLLTTSAGTGGTISPASGWYDSGGSASVSASPNATYYLTGFSGDLSGTATPQNLTMSAAKTVAAAFALIPTTTVASTPTALAITVDGSGCTTPCTFQWLPGTSHTLTVGPVAGGTGTQYVFASWSQGGAASQTVTAAASATTYTASFTTQYYLTTSAGAGGSITPASGWQNSGTVVPVTAAASAGYQFSAFSGALIGATTPQNVTMTAPKSVTASFTATQTVTSAPAGLAVTVDGTGCTTPCTFLWVTGSSHSVAAGTVPGGSGTQYAFVSWSQGGAASQSITAAATPNTYTATYKTQYYLTTSAGTGGTISPASGWYDSGGSASVSASPNATYYLTGFSGDLSGTATPQNLTMSAAKTVAAAFALIPTTTVASAPTALALTVDGSGCTTPCTFQWVPGTSHTVAAGTVAGGTGTQYVFASWSQGGAGSQTVTAAGSATTYTASFTTQYYLTTSAGAGGSITPASGWQNSGAVVPVSATGNIGYQFSGFSGALTGATSPQSVTMVAPKSVTANFTAVVTVQILNVTRGGSSVFPVGDSRRITVTGPANQAVTWTGLQNGSAVGATAGSTDASGNFTLNDVIIAGSLGSWSETWYVGGVAASPVLSFTVVNAVQTSIAVTPNGTFSQGQNGASYTVTVTNLAGSPATIGTVTVTETLPAALTLVSMTGSGWTCPSGGSTCTRSDALAAGASYPAIAVTVNVAAGAPSPQVNQVSASGGGALTTATATYSTVILGPPTSVLASPPGASGHKQTFSFLWSDPAGATDISTFQVKFATSSATTANTCWVSFDRAAGQITFHDDQGNQMAPAAFGSAAPLQNSQCIVYPGGSSLDTTGNQLTLTLSMGFLYTYTGAQPIWMRAGNTMDSGWGSAVGTYSVADSAPVVMGVSPSSGRGWTQTFAFTYSDADGVGDFNYVQVLFGSALTAANSCYMVLGNGLTGIYLADDSGNMQASLPVGVQGTRQNSQCSVDGAGSSVVQSGNNLTLNLKVTFSSAFAGAKNIWSMAIDNALAANGWVNSGSWTVGPLQDYTVSATPASATVLAGQTASYTVNLTTINGFNSAMNFTASGLPSGSTVAFSPVSNGSSTMTVTTAMAENGGPTGEYDLTISGSSNGLVRTTTVHVSVQDFIVTVSPAVVNAACYSNSSTGYVAVLPSTTNTPVFNLTVNGVNGFTGLVYVGSLPTIPQIYRGTTLMDSSYSLVTWNVSPYWITANGGIGIIGTLLRLPNATVCNQNGLYTVPFSNGPPSSGISHRSSTSVDVNANMPATVSLSLSPASPNVVNISPSGTASYSVVVTSQFNYSGTITLAVSGLPAGWTPSFYPSSTVQVTPSSPGIATLTIAPPAGSQNVGANFSVTANTLYVLSSADGQVYVTSAPAPGLSITTSTLLPAATVSTAYLQTLAATGGTPPYSWTVQSGSALPAGLSFSTGGVLSGTPTVAGPSSFTLVVADSGGQSANATFSLAIAAAALSITTPAALPAGTVSSGYSQTLVATGGTPPYTWTVQSGSSLPAGLILSGGALSGTPTALGSFGFTLAVADSGGYSATRTFSLTVTAAATYTLGGQVTLSGAGLAGVTLTLSGSGATRTSDSNGNYQFAGLAAGTYTVTASKTGYTFGNPVQVTLTQTNQAVNLTAQAVGPTFIISGIVRNGSAALPGVTVTLSGQAVPVTSDSTGAYSFSVPAGTYTVTPSSGTYTFCPAFATWTNLSASQTANFSTGVPAKEYVRLGSRVIAVVNCGGQ